MEDGPTQARAQAAASRARRCARARRAGERAGVLSCTPRARGAGGLAGGRVGGRMISARARVRCVDRTDLPMTGGRGKRLVARAFDRAIALPRIRAQHCRHLRARPSSDTRKKSLLASSPLSLCPSVTRRRGLHHARASSSGLLLERADCRADCRVSTWRARATLTTSRATTKKVSGAVSCVLV